jgi:cathepsin A (carboxypeptidase C)
MFGESYGGKYMIALATEIFKNGNKIPLQGFAIGNGWVNPDIQQRAYSTHGYGFGLYDYSSQVSINR